MRTRSIAFFALFILAFCAFCVTSGLFAAAQSHPDISAQLLCGDPAALEGFTLRQDGSIYGHLSIDVEYDAGSGETNAETRFHLADRYQSRSDTDPLLIAGAAAELYFRWDADEAAPVEDFPRWSLGIYEALSAELDASGERFGTVERELRCADYMDAMPLAFVSALPGAGPSGGAFSVDGFAVPLMGDETVTASLSRDPYGAARFTVEGGEGPEYNVNGGSISGDGCVYLLINGMDSGGRSCSPEHMPGGSWGVYRIPVEGGTLDFGGAVNILPIAEGEYGSAAIARGHDGLGLLLGADGGALRLSAFDEGGRIGGEIELLGAGDALAKAYPLAAASAGSGDVIAGDGFLAVQAGELILMAEYSGGAYSPLEPLDLGSLPSPGGAELDFSFLDGADADGCYMARSGERFALLEAGYFRPEGESSYDAGGRYLRLSVFERGECLCCEWLTSPLYTGIIYNLPQSRGFELLGGEGGGA